MKSDQERVSKLLTDTVTLLCKNGLVYSQEIKVQGLLGITLDKNEVFLVQINEMIGGNVGVPSCQQSTTTTSSEPSVRKKNTVACSSNVVDLTRVADNPRPVQQSYSSQVPPGHIAARRKYRPTVPETMMMPQQQQAPSRMQPCLRPRMTSSPLRGAMASQFASNYLAQLRQQVARGMSPMRMMPPERKRPVKQHTHEMMPAQTSAVTDDDDEDVVIVGTGHEEPSPSWSSPMRKRPLPSHMSSSPSSLQKLNQQSGQRPAFRHSSAVVEQLSSADVAGTLELTADDVATSIEDMIMKIAPAVMTTPKKHSSRAEMLPEACTAAAIAANSELPLVSAEYPAAVTNLQQPETAIINDTIAADAREVAAISQQNSADNFREDITEALQPFVYTDIACDMEEGGRADSLTGIEAPGFDVLTSDASHVDTGPEWSCHTWWRCHAPHCVAACAEASELARHYTVVHSAGLDLSIPPTVIVPTNIQQDSDAYSESSASDAAEGRQVDAAEVNRWPGIPCPFAGCALRIASYPGLVMHHKRVHGTPLPAKQRRAIATVYRARRLDADRVSNMSAPTATSAPHTASSSAVVSDSFVCPFSGCGISCVSRDDLVAHVQLSHEAADIIQPVCKQEKDDCASSSK